jgi:hypothetical protein
VGIAPESFGMDDPFQKPPFYQDNLDKKEDGRQRSFDLCFVLATSTLVVLQKTVPTNKETLAYNADTTRVPRVSTMDDSLPISYFLLSSWSFPGQWLALETRRLLIMHIQCKPRFQMRVLWAKEQSSSCTSTMHNQDSHLRVSA